MLIENGEKFSLLAFMVFDAQYLTKSRLRLLQKVMQIDGFLKKTGLEVPQVNQDPAQDLASLSRSIISMFK